MSIKQDFSFLKSFTKIFTQKRKKIKKSKMPIQLFSYNDKTRKKYLSDIIRKNLKKYSSTKRKYNLSVINSLIFEIKGHLTAEFKNLLIWDDKAEFLKRYYNYEDSSLKIPSICQYYEGYTLICSNYFGFDSQIVNIMKIWMQNKKQYLEYLEEREEYRDNLSKNKTQSKFQRLIESKFLNSESSEKSKKTLELTKYDIIDSFFITNSSINKEKKSIINNNNDISLSKIMEDLYTNSGDEKKNDNKNKISKLNNDKKYINKNKNNIIKKKNIINSYTNKSTKENKANNHNLVNSIVLKKTTHRLDVIINNSKLNNCNSYSRNNSKKRKKNYNIYLKKKAVINSKNSLSNLFTLHNSKNNSLLKNKYEKGSYNKYFILLTSHNSFKNSKKEKSTGNTINKLFEKNSNKKIIKIKKKGNLLKKLHMQDIEKISLNKEKLKNNSLTNKPGNKQINLDNGRKSETSRNLVLMNKIHSKNNFINQLIQSNASKNKPIKKNLVLFTKNAAPPLTSHKNSPDNLKKKAISKSQKSSKNNSILYPKSKNLRNKNNRYGLTANNSLKPYIDELDKIHFNFNLNINFNLNSNKSLRKIDRTINKLNPFTKANSKEKRTPLNFKRINTSGLLKTKSKLMGKNKPIYRNNNKF